MSKEGRRNLKNLKEDFEEEPQEGKFREYTPETGCRISQSGESQ